MIRTPPPDPPQEGGLSASQLNDQVRQGGAAANGRAPLEEFRAEYINLDPRLIEEDELNYELRARGVAYENIRTLEKKRILGIRLENERAENAIIAESPILFDVDIQECNKKINEISRFLGLRRKKRHEFYRVGAQLSHLEARVQRMHAGTGEQEVALRGLNIMIANAVEVFLQVVSTYADTDNQVAQAENAEAEPSAPVGVTQRQPIEAAALEAQLRRVLISGSDLSAANAGSVSNYSESNPTGRENIHMAQRTEHFIPANQINPDLFFGQFQQPHLPLSSTLNPARVGQPMFQNYFTRPSTVRGSVGGTSMRSVTFGSDRIETNDQMPFNRPSHAGVNNNPNATYDIPNAYNAAADARLPQLANGQANRGIQSESRQKTVPIHRWHIRFSGEDKRVSNKDLKLNEFLYLLQVQKTAMKISDADLLSQIHYLLTDSAQTWYFSCYDQFHDWDNFVGRIRERFLSPDHAVEAWQEIATRNQLKTETARTYLNKMVMAFRSLPMATDEPTQVAIIRRGLLPETRNIIGPWNVHTIGEMEAILARIQPTKPAEKKSETRAFFSKRTFGRKTVEAVNDEKSDSEEELELNEEEVSMIRKLREDKKKRPRDEKHRSTRKAENGSKESEDTNTRREEVKCHNCGERGHIFRNCTVPRRGIFCYKCGKQEVTTKECPCQSKNALESLDQSLTETSSGSDD